MAKQLTVLVAGATGRQGGAVAHALLAAGHHVRALTRNLAHPSAERLMRRGARLAWASFDNAEIIEESAQNVDAIFAMTSPFESGTDAEIRHGVLLADVAKRVGVKHLVYSSTEAASQRTGVAHFDSKYEVEQYIRAIGVPYTIVAPVFFMENFVTRRYLDHFRDNRLPMPLGASKKLQQVAIADIGRFVTLVLERGAALQGKRIAIASDELTGIETAATLARVVGRPIVYEEQSPSAVAEYDKVLGATFEWIAGNESGADVAELRKQFDIGWHTLDGWAKQQDWEFLLNMQPATAEPRR